MICCKIVAKYDDQNKSLSKLFDKLCAKGEILFSKGNLFYASETYNEKDVRKIFKKSGYDNFYLEVYESEEQAQEEEYIRGWVIDKMTRMRFHKYYKENEAEIADLSEKLVALNKILDEELAKVKKQEEVK